MSMIQCPACRGNRELRGLGNLMSPCGTCTAKGVVDPDTLPKPVQSDALLPNFGSPRETAQHYVKIEQQQKRDELKHANVAFLNKPVQIETKKENVTATQVAQRPPVALDPTIKQAPSIRDPKAPKPINPDSLEASKLRAETVERDDSMLAAQRADLGVEIETKEITPAKEKSSGKKSKSA